MEKHKNYGYSEPFLQPCYLVGILLIFLLTPVMSLFWASVVVMVPAFVIAKRVMRHYTKTWTAIDDEPTDYIVKLDQLLQTHLHMPKRHMKHVKVPAASTNLSPRSF